MASYWQYMANELNVLHEEAAVYHACLKKYISDGMVIYNENALTVMRRILDKHPNGCFDMIFADPPYLLSNDGFTCQNGQMVSVNKGEWDKSKGLALIWSFTKNGCVCVTRC